MEHKVVEYIDAPFDWIGEDDYSSHRQMLWLALNNTEDQVVEFGCGEGATELLYEYCKKNNRHFSSYENNETYAKRYEKIVTKITDYEQVYLVGFGLLFIDSAPGEQRKKLLENYYNKGGVIVLHDTEIGAQKIYDIDGILKIFKYRLDYYPKGMPGTTALSNEINVTKWLQ